MSFRFKLYFITITTQFQYYNKKICYKNMSIVLVILHIKQSLKYGYFYKKIIFFYICCEMLQKSDITDILNMAFLVDIL